MRLAVSVAAAAALALTGAAQGLFAGVELVPWIWDDSTVVIPMPTLGWEGAMSPWGTNFTVTFGFVGPLATDDLFSWFMLNSSVFTRFPGTQHAKLGLGLETWTLAYGGLLGPSTYAVCLTGLLNVGPARLYGKVQLPVPMIPIALYGGRVTFGFYLLLPDFLGVGVR